MAEKLNALNYALAKKYTDDEMEACGNVTIDETSPSDTKVYSSKTLTELAQSGDYPAYAKTEMETVATKIQNYIGTLNNPIIIGFHTDPHVPKVPSQGASTARDEIGYGMHTLRDLTKRFPFNLVVLGGDTNGSGDSIARMQESAMYVVNQLDGCNCPLVSLVGNHEGGQDNTAITRAQVLKSHMTPAMQNKTIVRVEGTNGYYDDDTCNVRFIFIESVLRSEANYITADVNSILASMLSTIPANYKAIIFSHHPLDENLPQVANRKGWNNPVSCHDTLQTYKDKIIACFNGHVHNNLNVDQDGITFVATTCAGLYELNDGSTRTSGTVDVTAYDVFVIDTDAKVIHAIRYGNGNDRDISYAHADQPRGNILNEITWTDGKRLNASGSLTDASNYSVTDPISNINAGDILYFADGTLVPDSGEWHLYRDDGTEVGLMRGFDGYGAGSMYVALLNDNNGVLSSSQWGNIFIHKNTLASNGRFTFGEFTFWNSGYIKSCKVAYDGEHFQNVAKLRFTFPTAKKANLDIRVNEPNAFPQDSMSLDGNVIPEVSWIDGYRLQQGQQNLLASSGDSVTSRIFDVENGDIVYFAEGTIPMFKNSTSTIYADDGSTAGTLVNVSESDYGTAWTPSHMIIGLYTVEGALIVHSSFQTINTSKDENNRNNWYANILTEIEYYESGYVKSAKIGNSNTHTNVGKIAFTLPTAKKSSYDIRINVPIT